MEVLYGDSCTGHLTGSYACALGFFDGVHLGHQNLISVLKNISRDNNLKSMVFTFEKHPMTLLDRENAPRLITDNVTKTNLFESLGVSTLRYSCVTRDLLNTSREDFLKDILIRRLNVKAIVAGFNFRFGFKGEGDSDYLLRSGKALGVSVHIVDPVFVDGILVSSTSVRNFLSSGNIHMANKLLGRNYTMRGKVVHGKERGRHMGFPTANMVLDKDILMPGSGVYITKVAIEGENDKKTGITNIGNNPTFGDNPKSIETHIIEFDKSIYDREIVVEFYEKIRDEVVFKSPRELSEQLEKDRIYALNFFK